MTRTTTTVTTLSGVAGAQRDRLDRPRPASTSGSWSATPSPRSSSTSAQAIARRLGDRLEVARRRRAEPGLARPTTTRSAASTRRSTSVFPDAVATPYVMMARDGLPLLHRDLPAGLPVHAVPDDQGAARRASTATTSTSASTTSSPACEWYRRLIEGLPSMTTTDRPADHARGTRALRPIVGFLVCVEIASGILQGYYTPIFSDIADHLVDPRRRRQLVRGRAARRLGARRAAARPARRPDRAPQGAAALHRGHRRWRPGRWRSRRPSRRSWSPGRCRASTSCGCRWRSASSTAARRAPARRAALTRRAAAFLVAALELGVIVGALTSGALVEAGDVDDRRADDPRRRGDAVLRRSSGSASPRTPPVGAPDAVDLARLRAGHAGDRRW